MAQGKKHIPTPELRQKVRDWIEGGVSRERIAKAMGLEPDTLRKHYREETEASQSLFEANFEKSICARALDPEGAPAIAIFVAKVKLGWREMVAKDPDKEQKPVDLTDAELRDRIAERARRLGGGPRASGLSGAAGEK